MFMHRLVIVAVVAVFVSAAQADTIFVDDDNCPGPGSGTERDPYCSIQTAIFNAVNTDVIIVAIGTYLESIDFLGKAITVRSTDPLDRAVVVGTVIDAQGSGTVVTCNSGEGPDTVLDGFTVTGGESSGMANAGSSPTVSNCIFRLNTGSFSGGMSNGGGSSTTVTNCIFEMNTASVRGGGMSNVQSSPTVTNCTFSQNTAGGDGGGMYSFQSSPTVTNCTFGGNTAGGGGGGMRNVDSTTTVTNCIFIGNAADVFGGGMHNRQDSDPTVVNCTFSQNTAGQDGGGIHTGVGTFANCTFSDNEAHGDGGGMFIRTGSPTVTNCIFTQNMADDLGGGMYNHNTSHPRITNCTFSQNDANVNGGAIRTGGATFANCIVWGNTSPGVNEILGTPTVTYSDVLGGFEGEGNINIDPLFIDFKNQDYHLSTGSPCIDAGNNWGVPIDENDYDEDGVLCELFPVDLDGDPRFNADEADVDPGCGVPVVVDIGAYEYQFDPTDTVVFADLNADGSVGAADLLGLLVNWGSCAKGCCLADLNIDGSVGASDLLALLVNWGPCP